MAKYDRLQYAVHKLKPGESVDKAFPSLVKRIPEFEKLKKRADYNRLVMYIMFLYDKNTDLADEHKILQDRKDAAATDAGYERVKGGKWPENVQKVMDIRDKEAGEAILSFLKTQKNHIWTEIIVTEQELDEFQRIRFNSITKKKGKVGDEKDVIDAANKKDKLKEACETRIKSLESLYNQFFQDHQDLRKAEFDEMITPENAERILEKEGPPYEEIKDQPSVDVPSN